MNTNCESASEGETPGPASAVCGRVLFVTSSFPRWAGDSTTPFILHLAQDLQKLGWQVHVLAPHADGARTSETLDGVPVHRFRYLWPASMQTVCYEGGALLNLRRRRSEILKVPALLAAQLTAVARRLSAGKFDVVHSHWLLPQGLIAGVAAKSLEVPHIVTVHGGDVFALQGGLVRPFKRAALRLADVVTVNSSATEVAVRAIDGNYQRIRRIPMGTSSASVADANRIAAIRGRYRRGEGPLLIFVGRTIEEKGVGDLLAAVARLREVLPDVSSLIVGDGPDRQSFMAQTRDLCIQDRVHFVGWAEPSAVAEYLRAADIFVGPSKRSPEGWVEAQGLVFIEAMLAGIPVIATASGGIADVVRDGESGLLVQEAEPHQIASAVIRLHRSPELRARLTDGGRILAHGVYSRDASAAQFSALYSSAMATNAEV